MYMKGHETYEEIHLRIAVLSMLKTESRSVIRCACNYNLHLYFKPGVKNKISYQRTYLSVYIQYVASRSVYSSTQVVPARPQGNRSRTDVQDDTLYK